MNGMDPSLLIGGDYVLLRMALVDDLGGDFESAIVLQRIAWRCERHPDGWPATHADIQQETRLSERKVKRALTVLRDRGYVTSRRASSWDPTQVWSVVLNRPSGDGRNVRHDADETSVTVADETSVTSLDHMKTKTKTKTGAADADAAPVKPGDAIAKAVYDATGKAVRYLPVRGVANWALKNRPQVPHDRIVAAMVDLHNAGKPITQALVAQVLDGIVRPVVLRDDAAQRERTVADRQAFGDHWANGGGW